MTSTEEHAVLQQPRRVDFQWALTCATPEIVGPGVAEDPRVTPAPIPPGRLKLADANILYLSPIVKQLVELWKGPESDDYGRLRPTQHAFEETIRLLVGAAIGTYLQQRQIPSGCVSTDSEGGVRIEWIRQRASVHFVVPATDDRLAYVYHKIANEYATEDVTPALLAYWLQRIE